MLTVVTKESGIMKWMSFIFLGCAFSVLGCTKMSEEELWRRVEQSRTSGNVDSTILVCQEILQEYPAGQKAAPALYSLAESYQNGKHDYRASVIYYRTFVAKYPDLKSTPLAIFVAGFIYNNNLQMTDSARLMYQDFLARFPGHELAASAKFELDNLGKTPDEIIAAGKDVAAKPSQPKKKK